MTNLTDRMRTCAAHLATASIVPNPAAIDDAAALLIAAADEIEALTDPIDMGEPMEIIPPVVNEPDGSPDDPGPWTGTWVAPGGPLPVANPYRSANACPSCDSRAPKRARLVGNGIMLTCPACSRVWRPDTKKPPAEGTTGGQD